MQNNTQRKSPFSFFTSLGLVTQIAIGLVLGIWVGVLVRNTALPARWWKSARFWAACL